MERRPPASFLTSQVPKLDLCLVLSTHIWIFSSKGWPPGCVCLWSVLTDDICQMNEGEKGNIDMEKVTENKQWQEWGQARERGHDCPESNLTLPVRETGTQASEFFPWDSFRVPVSNIKIKIQISQSCVKEPGEITYAKHLAQHLAQSRNYITEK